ncbi:glycerol-3-phosphate 1-O-acyltransferase PlsY [Anaerococcus sp. AGMB00486]|uniref:Glycerol-3-phosphate acyltransferase n=2 Tax=Anaerococcus TaxID=165779 RepID=A0ABX2N7K7_9FIRM|nr:MULTISPECIES: glycerol-3-phosphate 1-O-acyltransferase PlsY [Anaerococcus]MDY3005455.1 glycerol-3-phosphate 1-O-acyltransferase PlsY [Anaerococcus porci]MSS76883.1 glycerol-3-phosphate 1-O-acyltransferase PlsY [Anaerococcus porci]NVF10633.1 glycerol-3-phosphate 1-O-acyltransferase PlsY [Anaerococcus faecalis]
MIYILIAIISYLIGSIPFSYIIGKIFFKKDIRSLGSGNPGTTNVFRNFGPLAGCFTLFLDIAKGLVAVYIPLFFYGNSFALLALVFVIIGHIFSIFLKFKGGKGVATSAGALFAYDLRVFFILLFAFVVVFLITRTVSKASLTAAFLAPFIAYYFYSMHAFTIVIFIVAVFVIVEHRSNIIRIKNNEEKKMF